MQRWGLQEQTDNPPICRENPNNTGIPASIRPGIGVPRLKRKERDHTGIQKTPIQDDTYRHESNGWGS